MPRGKKSNPEAKKTTRKRRTKKTVSGTGAPVVEGLAEVVNFSDAKAAKANATPKRPKPGTPEWYALYPHVVADSVREPTAADLKNLSKCHGKVCTITCVDTSKARVINVQDAFQVTRTVEAQANHLKRRRTERRAAKKTVRQAAAAQTQDAKAATS
ncbi:hypothetical protein KAR91_05960 [Candidatus Pacearchaeota archaeon]|nr:hypothetical protein [Candidatus Pacearchaeota archaeon]